MLKGGGHLTAPDVYRLAGRLAEKFSCRHLIDLGCSTGVQLAPFAQTYQLIGIDKSREALDACIRQYPNGLWMEHDLGSGALLAIAQEALEHAVIVCANVVEWLENPQHLLHSLYAMMEHAKVCIMSTSEWNRSRLEALLAQFPFNVEFTGLTVDDEAGTSRTTWLAVIGNNGWAAAKSAGGALPNVTAIMTVFNEEDIVYESIQKLLDQEVFVYVIDNWSTDSSLEQIGRCWGHPYFQGLERFPHSGPSPHFRLAALLERVAELSQVLHGDWFIHHDVDEVRVPPWENMSLRQAAHYVETMGFNAIDFTVVNFQPVDNGFTGGDFESYFRYFSFGKELFHFNQVKMWRRLLEQRINFLDTGGHIARFQDVKVCPYKFLLKHYPLRSQQHAQQKVFRDRKARWHPDERAIGWHIQYDRIHEGDSVLQDPDELKKFAGRIDPAFYTKYVVERLSGIGIRERLL